MLLALLTAAQVATADAPPLADAYRLPSRDFATAAIAFNEAYSAGLRARQFCEPERYWQFDDARLEAKWLAQFWDEVLTVQTPHYYDSTRQRALARIRSMIGPEAYFRGEWPPCVPVWRFTR